MKIFLFLLVGIGMANALSSSDYDEIRDIILDTLKSNQQDVLSANLVRLCKDNHCKSNPNSLFIHVCNFAAFHDCVSPTCDGCLNMNNSANAGLQEGIDALTDIKSQYEALGITMNWADLMALGGQIGAEFGMELMRGHKDFQAGISANQLYLSATGFLNCLFFSGDARNFVSPFTFKTGRVECGDTAPYTDDTWTFPEPFMTYSEVMEFFEDADGFDMSPQEVS